MVSSQAVMCATSRAAIGEVGGCLFPHFSPLERLEIQIIGFPFIDFSKFTEHLDGPASFVALARSLQHPNPETRYHHNHKYQFYVAPSFMHS